MSEFNDEQAVPLDQQTDAYEEIFERLGEPALHVHRDKIIALAREISGQLLDTYIRWLLPSNMERRQVATVGHRVIASAWVINPQLLRVRACAATIARRLGYSWQQVQELRRAGKLEEVVATATDGVDTDASLHQIAKAIGVTAALLSPHSAEFTRRFGGIANGGKGHDWRVKEHHESERRQPDEPDDSEEGGHDGAEKN